MDVRIDETGEDILPARVDHIAIVRRSDVALDLRDRFAFAEDIRVTISPFLMSRLMAAKSSVVETARS